MSSLRRAQNPPVAFALSLQEFDPGITFSSGHLFHVWQEDGVWIWPTRGRVLRFRVTDNDVVCEGGEESFISYALGLDEPYEDILTSLASHPALAGAVQRFRGLRLLRQDPWECALGFLNATMSSVKRVRGHLWELACKHGETVEGTPMLPGPSAIPDESVLRKMGLGYRAKFIGQLAVMAAALEVSPPMQPFDRPGALLLRDLVAGDLETTLKQLMSLPGVGRKVASCIALYSLDQSQAIPVDVWIRRELLRTLKKPVNTPDTALERSAQRKFKPWTGYAQQFLYQEARQKEK